MSSYTGRKSGVLDYETQQTLSLPQPALVAGYGDACSYWLVRSVAGRYHPTFYLGTAEGIAAVIAGYASDGRSDSSLVRALSVTLVEL